MKGITDIQISEMLLFSGLFLLPLLYFIKLKLPLWRDLIVSVIRMLLQLTFIGFYLKYLFAYNSLALNCLWVIIMILIANSTILKRSGLKRRTTFGTTIIGLAVGTVATSALLLGIAVKPEPLYDAHYLIPMAGMILGNSLQSNVIALDRFFSDIEGRYEEYKNRLFFGATVSEATAPFLVSALQASLSPTIATMMTIGLVSLPGMMTGQILGGSPPMVAIKYQILIMMAIFLSIFFSTVINLHLMVKSSFDGYGLLKKGIRRK